jgi:signal transduction histidine kinase
MGARRGTRGMSSWTVTTVLVLGVLSLALLVWIDHIGERQRRLFAFLNALTDLRVSAGMLHLTLEEVSHGEPETDIEATLGDAVRLSRLLLTGGESEGLVVTSPDDPDLRRDAGQIEAFVMELAAVARAMVGQPARAAPGSVLELRMHAVSTALQRTAARLEKTVEDAMQEDYQSSRRLFVGTFAAWSSILVVSILGLVRRERRRRNAEAALQSAKADLETRVAERTSDLSRLNGELDIELGERIRAAEALRESEAQLRELSARLLTSEEAERSRIASELHDGLGHSLVCMKLGVRTIQRQTTRDPEAASQECDAVLGFIDDVVKDVRRLAMALRPTVLEDLGLSAALRNLAKHAAAYEGTHVEALIDDVDELVPPETELLIYRIAQEAFTNIAKHARARHASLTAERRGNRLHVVVEDDGIGLPAGGPMPVGTGEPGLGLVTMQDRARMLGGSLDIWSEPSKGTRITLTIPLATPEVVDDTISDHSRR